MLERVGDDRDRADRDAYARMDGEARPGFFYARTAAGIPRSAPSHEGASLYVAGFGHAAMALSEQWTQAKDIAATPFEWIEPEEIPARAWVYGRHYARKFLSATIAPGGVGKSSLTIVEALSIASGRALLDVKPEEQTAVWLWNGEDPLEELQRRIAAACRHYELSRRDIADRLFVDTGREMRIIIAEQARNGTVVTRPVVDRVIESIRERDIGTMIVDPFVACHRAAENDNNAIEAVVAAWAEIADATGCAIELVHHSRKIGTGVEVTADDARGASSLVAKTRSARVINAMNKDEAERYDVENSRLYFRVDNGKANLAVPSDKADWYRLASVDLGNGPANAGGLNGDSVGVVATWDPPEALEGVQVHHLREVQTIVRAGRYRESNQADAWVGKVVADVMRLDPTKKGVRSKIGVILKTWIDNKMLKVVMAQDEQTRKQVKFVEVGEPATD